MSTFDKLRGDAESTLASFLEGDVEPRTLTGFRMAQASTSTLTPLKNLDSTLTLPNASHKT